ncbi:MAG: heme ABC transporter ATP-binding protein [Pyrinomonadaceae bacterium]
MIEARGVSVRIGAATLLENVSLRVVPGELLAVVGPNGAGKSTLRRALCGDAELSGGAVSMDARPLGEWSLVERARARAVMPQDSSLTFPFTVLEVALMGRLPHLAGAEGPRDYEIARAALDAVEARHLEERLYPTLSSGERQRVHLARVLAQVWEHASPSSSQLPTSSLSRTSSHSRASSPSQTTSSSGTGRYLLLDEPTSNLDLAHQHGTLAVARRFAREGAGVLVILHDLNLAAQYADRVVMLKDGRVARAGSPAEVFTTEAIREVFNVSALVTGHPSMGCPLIVTLPNPAAL